MFLKKTRIFITGMSVLCVALSLAGCSGREVAIPTESNTEQAEEGISEVSALEDANVEATAGEFGLDSERSNFFSEMPDSFTFSSGAGAWATYVEISEDGSFTGQYHDSDMGDIGEGYPNGTVYISNFYGRFSEPEPTDSQYIYSMKLLDLQIENEEKVGASEIVDGIMYVYTTPYGFEDADEFLIYMPGSPLSEMTEECLSSVEKRVFSTTLQSLRKEKKVTQEQLAQSLGVSPQAVSKWENGSYPEGNLLPAIADFFDVSIDYLYGRSDGEKTIEQKVFEAVYDETVKEFEDTGRADEHYKASELMRNIIWAMINGLWVNNKNFEKPSVDSKEHPKMASVVCDDVFYSYFGLREDNNFSFFLNKTKNYDMYEELFKDTSKMEALFKILSDRENILILAFLYTLKPDEFVSVDVISKSLGIDRSKVKKLMDMLFDDMKCETENFSSFKSVRMVNASSKEEKIYGADFTCGGLFMALMMIAKEFTDLPMAFRLRINAKQKCWLDRKKLFKR